MTETTTRPGRKPPTDRDAPHGRDENGTPLAPHGYLSDGRPRQYPLVKTDLPDLTADALATPVEVPPVLAPQTKPRAYRTEQQQAIDKVVQKVHAKWTKAGKPSASAWPLMLEKKLVAGYWVSPDSVPGLRSLLERSATYLKLRIKFGEHVSRPEDAEQDGKVYIPFVVMDRMTRPSGDGNGNNEKSSR